MPTTAGGSYYADASTPASIATISAAMANAEETRFDDLTTTYALPYEWANSTNQNNTTGMVLGQTGIRTDTGLEYRYNGSTWQVIQPAMQLVIPTSVSGTGMSLSTNGSITFAAVTAGSINGCFTSRFTNYRLVGDLTLSAAAGLNMTLRVSGTDATTAYDNQRMTVISTATSVVQSLNQAAIFVNGGISIASSRVSFTMELYGPAVAAATSGTITALATPNPMTTSAGMYFGGILHRTATAYDGFTLTPGSGNVSGTLRVYGYNE